MTIKIYPNKLEGAPVQTVETDRRMTLGAWQDSFLKTPRLPGEVLPISIKVNDEIIDSAQWDEFVFLPRDDVEIRVEPKGTDPFSITVALLAGAVAVFNALTPALPGTPNSPGTGDSIASGSAKGNKVKLGDPIRESFGLQKIYPDYLLPPHKYYSDYRAQQMELMLCVGKGRFQVNANNVRIGDTPLIGLGDEASYQLFEPSESVTSNSASSWWHQAAEVGSSSTGAAGLELTVTTSVTQFPDSFTFTFSGYSITSTSNFPADWSIGLILRVEIPYTYTVTDGGGSARDVITGPLGMLNPSVGDALEVTGANAGIYEVASYSASGPSMTLNYENGLPANQMALGQGQAAIGPQGLRFKITAISGATIQVDRLDSAGGVDSAFPGFDNLTTSNARLQVDSANTEGGWRGWFAACPDGEVTDLIEWDMFFPNGLCWVGNKGNVVSMTAAYSVQYRDAALGPTAPVTQLEYTHSNNTLDQGGYTTRLRLPYPMRPEFRMRKVLIMGESLEFHDTINWTGLKALLPAPSQYAGVTTLGLRAQVSDRIASQVESLVYVIGTRMLPNANTGALQATREIAPAAMYVARSLGLTDSQIDTDELYRLNNGVWADRGDHFDKAFTDESTAKEVLNQMFSAGFAELTTDRGVIRPVRDEPRTTFEHMYSPQNMTDSLSREVTMPGPDDYDGVQVTYLDRSTWAETTVDCLLPGDTTYRKIEKVNAEGVIDRNKAYQYGMRRRRAQVYRRDSYSWSTEMDALNSRYMSYCSVSDDVPGYSQSALLVDCEDSGASQLLTVSEAFDWSDAARPVVALRRPDGTVSGPYEALRVGEFTIRISGLDFEPELDDNDEPPHVQFGDVETWSYPVLVTEVDPDGIESANVRGIGYDARVYLDDNSSAPN